jgi:hypothetical protein
MKKVLLSIIVVCCSTGIAVAQDGNKTAKKKVVNQSRFQGTSADNAARNKDKEAKAKAFESGKVQTTAQRSKASLAVDRAN